MMKRDDFNSLKIHKLIIILFMMIMVVPLSCIVDDYTNIAVSGVALDKTNLTLTVGSTGTLTESVIPANAPFSALIRSSNNEIEATGNNGTVAANAAETATITAATYDGN